MGFARRFRPTYAWANVGHPLLSSCLFCRVFGHCQVGFGAIDVPGLEELGDDCEGKTRSYQAADQTRCLLIVFRFLNPLPRYVAPGQIFLVYLLVGGLQSRGYQLRVNALPRELLLYPAFAEALVFLAEASVRGGKGGIVEVALVQKTRHHGRYLDLSGLTHLDPAAHETFELSHS